MTRNDSDSMSRLDRATADRLAKLSSLPVDTSHLAARLRQEIPLSRPRVMTVWLRPMRIAAAILILLGALAAVIVFSSGGPVLASPDVLAHVHQEMISGDSHGVRKVSSLDDAAAALSQQWPDRPALPEMPGDRVMACCVHEMGRKKMAVVGLMINDVPVSMAVADSSEIKMPEGSTKVHEGITYHVQSSGGVNMVMHERGGRWICLMGGLPIDSLMQLASKIRS